MERRFRNWWSFPRAMIFNGVVFLAFVPSALGCRETVTLNSTRPTYTFNSPNFPNNQTVGRCIWTIIAPTAKIMTISCPVIDLLTYFHCILNPFIFSANGRRESICGSDVSVNRSASVTTFTVDYTFRAFFTPLFKGFTCTVSFIPDENTTNELTSTTTSTSTTTTTIQPTTTTPPPCVCGIENSPLTRIIGGENATQNQFPWMAYLNYTMNGRPSICGGSLISPEWILTAAHCVDGFEDIEVTLGGHNLNENEKPELIFREVKFRKIFEGYNSKTGENDIALLKIDKVPISREISPICLPLKSKAISGKARVAGWGYLEEINNTSPQILQVVELDLHTYKECQSITTHSNVTDNMICATAPGKDSCGRDSGGPLFVREEDNNFQVGIVSFGTPVGPCGSGNPTGVYTKVENYIDWIECKTKESFCQI